MSKTKTTTIEQATLSVIDDIQTLITSGIGFAASHKLTFSGGVVNITSVTDCDKAMVAVKGFEVEHDTQRNRRAVKNYHYSKHVEVNNNEQK